MKTKIFLLDELRLDKLKRKKIDVILVSRKILRDVEKGKKILEKLFLLKKEKNFLIGIEGTSYKKDKTYLELKIFGIPVIDIFFPHLKDEKKEKEGLHEGLHFANSGLNHVLLNIMSKNLVAIGIDVDEIIEEIKKKNSTYVSRFLQNVRWARKRNVNFCLIAKKQHNPLDIKHFLLAIGFDTKQVKKAFEFLSLKKQLNKEIFEHKRGKLYFYKKDEEIKLLNYLVELRR